MGIMSQAPPFVKQVSLKGLQGKGATIIYTILLNRPAANALLGTNYMYDYAGPDHVPIAVDFDIQFFFLQICHFIGVHPDHWRCSTCHILMSMI